MPKDRKPYEYCLHHIDESLRHNDIDRYIQWYGYDLVVELYGEHSSHTNKGRKRSEEWRNNLSKRLKGRESPRKGCVVSEETKQKMSNSRKKYFDNGGSVWNKGLTKYTDERIKVLGEKESNTKRSKK